MATQKILGSGDAVETGYSREESEKRTRTVTVEGLLSDIELESPEDHCPSGYEIDSYNIASSGDGMGKMTIRCVKYNSGASFDALRTTFRVDMLEVQYDLEDHPYLASVRDMCVKWLGTDESKRVNGTTYKYEDENGSLTEITDATAKKFCAAYMAGIKTFMRFYPVIEKQSTYSNPPGMSRSGKSFTGGSPTFSQGIGEYDTPPLNLSGYASTNWFKSKDSWVENGNRTWTRTEQWTYTPESSSGNHAWVYNEL